MQSVARREGGIDRDRTLIKNELLLGRRLLGNFSLSLTSVRPCVRPATAYLRRVAVLLPLPFDSSLSKDHGEQVPRLSTLDAQRVPAGFSWKLPQPGLRQLLPPPVPVQQRIPPHRHAVLARSSLSGLSQGKSRPHPRVCRSVGCLRPAETSTVIGVRKGLFQIRQWTRHS